MQQPVQRGYRWSLQADREKASSLQGGGVFFVFLRCNVMYYCADTAILNPVAFNTAVRVFMVGLPLADIVR